MASRKRALGAGNSGRVGIAGVIGTAGERGTSGAARDSEGAGVGGWGDEGEMGAAGGREPSSKTSRVSVGGHTADAETCGNKVGRGTCTWACSYCGYRPQIAVLNSHQDFGSSSVSRMSDHVFHDSSSV